jgi:hypothetical protein
MREVVRRGLGMGPVRGSELGMGPIGGSGIGLGPRGVRGLLGMGPV